MSLDDLVRRRIKVWMAANPSVTLTALGLAAGYNQPWATRFLNAEFDANLDALARIAALFKQPITALFEQRDDPLEDELLMRFRGVPDHRKQLLLDLARDYAPDEPVKRGRRGRARSDAPSGAETG